MIIIVVHKYVYTTLPAYNNTCMICTRINYILALAYSIPTRTQRSRCITVDFISNDSVNQQSKRIRHLWVIKLVEIKSTSNDPAACTAECPWRIFLFYRVASKLDRKFHEIIKWWITLHGFKTNIELITKAHLYVNFISKPRLTLFMWK